MREEKASYKIECICDAVKHSTRKIHAISINIKTGWDPSWERHSAEAHKRDRRAVMKIGSKVTALRSQSRCGKHPQRPRYGLQSLRLGGLVHGEWSSQVSLNQSNSISSACKGWRGPTMNSTRPVAFLVFRLAHRSHRLPHRFLFWFRFVPAF